MEYDNNGTLYMIMYTYSNADKFVFYIFDTHNYKVKLSSVINYKHMNYMGIMKLQGR